jgi:hypothetical protein
MKLAVIWVVGSCSLVVYRVSEVLAASIITTLMMQGTSEMLVNFYHTTQRYNPEDSHLQKLYPHSSVIPDKLS